MKTLNSDRVKNTRSSQVNHQVSAEIIITQLETVRNQIRGHSGKLENSVDLLARLREGNTNNRKNDLLFLPFCCSHLLSKLELQ